MCTTLYKVTLHTVLCITNVNVPNCNLDAFKAVYVVDKAVVINWLDSKFFSIFPLWVWRGVGRLNDWNEVMRYFGLNHRPPDDGLWFMPKYRITSFQSFNRPTPRQTQSGKNRKNLLSNQIVIVIVIVQLCTVTVHVQCTQCDLESQDGKNEYDTHICNYWINATV